MLNPYIVLGVLLAIIGAASGGYIYGGKHARNAMEAQELREQRLLDKVAETTAEQIAQIEIKNTTIRQKVETVTREVPVYRDCEHTDDVYGLLNDALEGGPLPSPGVVSKADSP